MLITSGSERVKFVNIEIFRISRMVFETLKSDQYLISPYSNTAESFIKITRVKEMIDCQLIKEALIARQILLVSTKGNV